MSRRLDLATIVVVLLLILSGVAAGITGPTHEATSGVNYVTNSGLDVQLADDREVEAVPFADNQTFASDNATLSSPGTSAATVSDQTFSGDTMSVSALDSSSNPVTIGRGDLSSNLTLAGGATSVILHDVALDDGATDVEFTADSQTTLRFENVPDAGGIQAVASNGEIVAGTSSTSGGTATLQFDAGEYDIRLQEGTSELEIRDLQTQELITEGPNGSAVNVEVQLFGSEDTTRTFNTTTGTIDWTGLPADERFAVSIDAGEDYYQRNIIIPSLVEQSTAYLLNASDPDTEVVRPRFLLEDPSNQFDSEQSEIIFERPLEINGTTQYVAVTGDRIGLNGFDAILEEGQRYRVTVRDPDSGAERRLGEYTPTASETVTLSVQDVEFDSVSDVDGLNWGAEYVTNENQANEIEFIYRDTVGTESLEYRIVERGNASNVLASGSATGNVTVTEPVPPSESDTVWRVSFNATRTDGETLSGSRVISSNNLPVGDFLPTEWQTAFSVVTLFVVAGLFGGVNPGVGGIAVSSTGGFFFLLGWLPGRTTGLMVLLAFFVAVLSYAARQARGATA
ncbi:MAG: hypothetical protein HQRvContig04_18 [Haloquadratum phage sp.]|nr:MAG: hypothetical protein HQRvContig04_18 [Haloquadratum phage sp.]